jgi:choline dehydrogenase
MSFLVPLRDSIHRYLSNPILTLLSILEFFIFGTGVFLSAVSEYFCYLHSQKLPPKQDNASRELPDLEIIWTTAWGSLNFPKFPSGQGGACVMIQNSTPKSVGTVRLKREGSNDVKVDPIVDPNYLSAKEDWDVYRRGIVFSREIAAEMRRTGYPVEEAEVPASNSVEDLDAHIRKFSHAGQHLLSSCPMRPLEDGGVVDRELKVYGIEGLRIADGSVVPRMLASRPQATIVMIAERCADFIIQEWGRKGTQI